MLNGLFEKLKLQTQGGIEAKLEEESDVIVTKGSETVRMNRDG